MNITVAIQEYEMDEVNRVLNGHADMISGDISRDKWLKDEVRYPRKTWLYLAAGENRMPFVVVDNRDGQCFVEQFETLDGAMLYACDVYLTGEHQETWDYPGAVKDRGNLKIEESFPCI